MAVLPDTRLAQIEWFEQRLGAWLLNASDIGLTGPQVAQLQGEITAARVAYTSAQQARNQSKSSTVNYYDASDTLVGDGRDLISTIKAFAETTNDPNVYVLADVPPPAPPGVIPPPGTPFDFRVGLRQDGSIELGWKSNNPSGGGSIVYEILRSDAGGPMNFVSNAGEREFVDATIPPGTDTTTYQVTGIRGTERGAPAQFNVRFGAGNQQGTVETGGEELSIAA